MDPQLLLPLLIVLFAVMFYMQIRRQKKANQEQQKLQNSLTAGDRVMTTSGLFGTVVSTADNSVDLEISPGVVTTWLSAAIREKVDTEQDSDGEQAAADTAEDDTAEASDESKAAKTGEADSTESKTETAKAETTESETGEAKATESGAEVAEPIEKQKTS